MRRKMNRRDWILLAVLAAVAVLLFPLLSAPGGEAVLAEIWVDGVLTETLPLARDTVHTVETPWGINTVVIEGGTVRVESADCPGQECVGMGRVSESGRSLICLPHKLSIVLVGGEGEVDAVAS